MDYKKVSHRLLSTNAKAIKLNQKRPKHKQDQQKTTKSRPNIIVLMDLIKISRKPLKSLQTTRKQAFKALRIDCERFDQAL